MGRRIGTKRSDKRWEDDEGNAWPSKLECTIYEFLRGEPRIIVRRCEKGGADTFAYTSAVRSSECAECGSGKVVQRRTYTPDLYVLPPPGGDHSGGYYLELKGYWRGPQRKLLGDFLRTGPDIDLRIVFQSDKDATPKLTYLEYAIERLKIPACVWGPGLPESWYE